MRVVILGPAYPLRGGIAHYIGLLAAELSKSHEVHVVTFKRQYPRLLFPGKTQEETGAAPDAAPAPELIDSVNPWNWFSVSRTIRSMKPDLLIFKYWLPFFGACFGTIARRVKRGTGAKVLYICDNVIPHERRIGDRVLTRYAFGPADYFIVQSGIVERDLLRLKPGARFRRAPHPLYNLFGEPVEKSAARRALGVRASRVLLFFGYVRRYKGLHTLIDAMARVPRDLGVHLLVVGEFYDDEAAYRSHVEKLGLESAITFLDQYVPNDRVKLFFSAADAVVLPYLSATQSGIAQIAYNFDTPVIATDAGGLGEVVLDGITGCVVPPADPDALAAGIARFYREGTASALVEGVRREKQKYTWENLARAIEEMAGSAT